MSAAGLKNFGSLLGTKKRNGNQSIPPEKTHTHTHTHNGFNFPNALPDKKQEKTSLTKARSEPAMRGPSLNLRVRLPTKNMLVSTFTMPMNDSRMPIVPAGNPRTCTHSRPFRTCKSDVSRHYLNSHQTPSITHPGSCKRLHVYTGVLHHGQPVGCVRSTYFEVRVSKALLHSRAGMVTRTHVGPHLVDHTYAEKMSKAKHTARTPPARMQSALPRGRETQISVISNTDARRNVSMTTTFVPQNTKLLRT